MILDDRGALHKIDRSDMLSLMEKTPERLEAASDAYKGFDKTIGRPQNVVFGGLGGSAIAGDILADYSRDIVDVPVCVCRSMKLPAYVGRQTLFVAISYSGETRETLAIMNQAKQRRARIVSISSGGKLLSQSREEGTPCLRVMSDLLPRVALPELLAAAVFAMSSAELIEEPSSLLSNVSRAITAQIDRLKPNTSFHDNYAKQTAQVLANRLPVIVGGEENGSVLRRFKNELNENAKIPAFCWTLPDGYHNDVEGLRSPSKLPNAQIVFLRGMGESEGERRTREKFLALLNELGYSPPLYFEGSGENRLSQLLAAVMFGDYVSVYLAALLGKDPSELTLIRELKKVMCETESPESTDPR